MRIKGAPEIWAFISSILEAATLFCGAIYCLFLGNLEISIFLLLCTVPSVIVFFMYYSIDSE